MVYVLQAYGVDEYNISPKLIMKSFLSNLRMKGFKNLREMRRIQFDEEEIEIIVI